jgi:hypothetical protein
MQLMTAKNTAPVKKAMCRRGSDTRLLNLFLIKGVIRLQ